MAWDSSTKVRAVKFGDIDEVFDERGSAYLALRKIQWVGEGDEPDESKARFEIRKWRIQGDGERADKGVGFLTEDGPHELAKVLVKNGFGNTKEILHELKKRDDFKEAVEHFYDSDEETGSGEYYDMRSLLNNDDAEFEDAS